MLRHMLDNIAVVSNQAEAPAAAEPQEVVQPVENPLPEDHEGNESSSDEFLWWDEFVDTDS